MSEIPKGTRVRVTYEAEYDNHNEWYGWVLRPTPNGGASTHSFPLDATVEVISDPLPPEPPVGAYVEVQWVPHPPSPERPARLETYEERTPHMQPEVFVRGDGWFSLSTGKQKAWQDFFNRGAEVTRLYRADDPDIPQRVQEPLADWELELLEQKARDEQPQERYERVQVPSETQSGETALLWFHPPCGYVGRWLSDEDPNAHRNCVCRNCAATDPWTPLYVKADSDG